MPEAGWVMLNTRMVNKWLGSSYTLEQVSEWPLLAFEVLAALAEGMEPPRKP